MESVIVTNTKVEPDVEEDRVVQWYYQNDEGKYISYTDLSTQIIEDHFQAISQGRVESSLLKLQSERRIYQVDVVKQSQRNKQTGKVRAIIRLCDGKPQHISHVQKPINKISKDSDISKQGVWQFNGETGWRDYDEQSQSLIRVQFEKFKKSAQNNNLLAVQSAEMKYEIDFLTMKQYNIVFKTFRDIRLTKV